MRLEHFREVEELFVVITVRGISKLLGKRDLFQEVSFHIHSGQRVGLIGPNGAGKTTLFHILLGETEPDAGTVEKSKNLRMGYLPQQWVPAEEKAVLAHAMDVDRELQAIREELQALQRRFEAEEDEDRVREIALQQSHFLEKMEHLGGYDLEARARKVLSGLGFPDAWMDRPVSTLSGGWVMRLELARLLLAEPDILLLDEPTNHLDIESLLWLEQYLLSSSSAMIIISHDRVFLNRVVTRIFELDRGRLEEYTGSYDDYLEDKARREEIRSAAYKNQQERIRQIERFVERNRYRKDRARQAQSRLKLLEKIERIESPDGGDVSIHFRFPEPPRSGKRVIELHDVHKAYEGYVVYSGIDLVVERGDRVAFLGRNGAGKSTLLKIMAGVEPVSGGERSLGHQVVPGYYAQYQWEQLRPEWTILEEASSVAGDLSQTQLRGLLGAFLFRGEDVLKKVAALSGGEKARLLLCKLLLMRPNVLLLDEPTNHLDIPSRDVLERALREFPGTVCFISHDRHFINAIANKVLTIDSGRVHLLPGNFDDYRNIWVKRLEEEESGEPGGKELKGERSPQGTPARRGQQRKRLEAEWRNELYALRKPLQQRMEASESALEEYQHRLSSLNALLADPETYRNGSRVQELQKEYQQCRKDIQRLTEEWEKNALALEELEENFWSDKGRVSEEPGP